MAIFIFIYTVEVIIHSWDFLVVTHSWDFLVVRVGRIIIIIIHFCIFLRFCIVIIHSCIFLGFLCIIFCHSILCCLCCSHFILDIIFSFIVIFFIVIIFSESIVVVTIVAVVITFIIIITISGAFTAIVFIIAVIVIVIIIIHSCVRLIKWEIVFITVEVSVEDVQVFTGSVSEGKSFGCFLPTCQTVNLVNNPLRHGQRCEAATVNAASSGKIQEVIRVVSVCWPKSDSSNCTTVHGIVMFFMSLYVVSQSNLAVSMNIKGTIHNEFSGTLSLRDATF